MAKKKTGYKEYKSNTYGVEVTGILDSTELIIENESMGKKSIAEILSKFNTDEVTITIVKKKIENLTD